MRHGSGSRRPAGVAAAGLLAGVLADALVADPRRGHPVAGFGRVAAATERAVYRDSRVAGTGYALGLTGGTAAAAWLVDRRLAAGPGRFAALTLTTWAVVGARSLGREAYAVHAHLAAGDLAAARVRVSSLVGRDPSALDEAGIARAVVESVAENTGDAVVAPLLWGAVAGMPGLAAYRAVNTLDAMVGHRSPRYRRFGWAAARTDDLANLVPARITAVLVALVSGRPRAVVRAVRTGARRHPSPNAGWCESAFAGALDLRLGGVNVYASGVERRPELGTGRPAQAADIAAAVRLQQRTTAAAAGLAALVAVIVATLRGRRP